MSTPSHGYASPDGEVIVGTLYCWNTSQRTRAGEYRHDAGQLLWSCLVGERVERAFAVLVGSTQVRVVRVDEQPGSKPAKLRIQYETSSGSAGSPALETDVELGVIVKCALAGYESVKV